MTLVKSVGAQNIKHPVSINYSGLQAYSKNFSDILSAAANEASVAEIKTGGFAVYGERRFMMEELNNYAAVVALPTTSGVFGCESDYFGSHSLHESSLGLLYARKVTNHFNVGVKFNYYTVTVAGYGSGSSINLDAGAVLQLTDNLFAGAHAYNPGGSKLGKSGQEKLASRYTAGLGYEVSEQFFISTEIVKQENEAIDINAGFQYNLQKNVFIRTGISTLNDNSYAAVGLQLSFVRIDLNAAYHPQLGFTPGLLLLFNLKKQENN